MCLMASVKRHRPARSVGAVYEPNGTTTRTRHCAQKSGSRIARCSDGWGWESDTVADESREWTYNFTSTSRVTDRLLEFEEVMRSEGASVTYTDTRMIAIRYSGSGCELARYTWTWSGDNTVRIDVKASDCKIVW